MREDRAQPVLSKLLSAKASGYLQVDSSASTAGFERHEDLQLPHRAYNRSGERTSLVGSVGAHFGDSAQSRPKHEDLETSNREGSLDCGTASAGHAPWPATISESGRSNVIESQQTFSTLHSMQPFNRLASTRLGGSAFLKLRPAIRTQILTMSTGAAETDVQAENVAKSSGITPTSLQDTLKEKLQAEHVDVEDMSGTSDLQFSLHTGPTHDLRWLRTSLQRHDCLVTV